MKLHLLQTILTINPKIDNGVTVCRHDIIINFFNVAVCFSFQVSLHVNNSCNIITGFRVVRIFVFKRLTRNLDIGKTPVWIYPVSGDWGKLGIPNIARLFLINSYGMLQNPGLLQLLRFWVIKGKLKKGVKLPLTQIRVKNNNV